MVVMKVPSRKMVNRKKKSGKCVQKTLIIVVMMEVPITKEGHSRKRFDRLIEESSSDEDANTKDGRLQQSEKIFNKHTGHISCDEGPKDDRMQKSRKTFQEDTDHSSSDEVPITNDGQSQRSRKRFHRGTEEISSAEDAIRKGGRSQQSEKTFNKNIGHSSGDESHQERWSIAEKRFPKALTMVVVMKIPSGKMVNRRKE